MKFLRWLSILLIPAFLNACGGSTGINIPGVPTETALPQPIVNVTSAPSVDAALRTYLDALHAGDYNTMHSLLSKPSQDANPLENFALRNRDALNMMSASLCGMSIASR